MEAEGFAPMEIEDHLVQLRDAIRSSDTEARRIVSVIMQGSAGHALLERERASAASAATIANPLKLNHATVGGWVTISSALFSAGPVPHNWVPQMDATFGRRGVILAIDRAKREVLVQTCDESVARFSEWWYPVSVLESSAPPPQWRDVFEIGSLAAVCQAIQAYQQSHTACNIRRILLEMVGGLPVPLLLGIDAEAGMPGIRMDEVVRLLSHAFDGGEPLFVSTGIAARLTATLAEDTSVPLAEWLTKYCCDQLRELAKLSAAAVSVSSGQRDVEHVSFSAPVSRVCVSFSRRSVLQPGSKATLSFFADESCMRLLR
jgi:hypothetical protein